MSDVPERVGIVHSDAPGDKQPGATLSLPPPMASHRVLVEVSWGSAGAIRINACVQEGRSG
jgi:hypothetical protein